MVQRLAAKLGIGFGGVAALVGVLALASCTGSDRHLAGERAAEAIVDATDRDAGSGHRTAVATDGSDAGSPDAEPTTDRTAADSAGADSAGAALAGAEPTGELPEGFGRYLVARAEAGDTWHGRVEGGATAATRVIPVFDYPDGPERMLVDGAGRPLPLFNWTDHGSPTVLRVIAGEPGHSWALVQAPTTPHNQQVWVRTAEFRWAETDRRIEIDLADRGRLTVFDGDVVVLDAAIVQGRDNHPSRLHVTYLQAGRVGSAALEIADSSGRRSGRAEVLDPAWARALTIPHSVDVVASEAAARSHPQLWSPCAEPGRVCRAPEVEPWSRPTFRYAIIRDPNSTEQVPVFDAPHPQSPPRTLIDRDAIAGTSLANPLFARTLHGNPLVLRVLAVQGAWLKAQVPTRPNHSHAWVRAGDFAIRETDTFIEIALGPTPQSYAGEMLVYDGDELRLRVPVVSGRESRPTPLVTGWVTQQVRGPDVGPAYGSWILGPGTFSEVLSEFGGMAPGMAIHSTNQPGLMGQRVSSTKVRITNEQLDTLVAVPGLVGAPAFVHARQAHLSARGGGADLGFCEAQVPLSDT